MPGDAMTEACSECPRFDRCSVNNCPLHSRYNKGLEGFDDLEQKCTIAKTIRERIGRKYNLPNLGLTPGELKGKKRWDALPEEQKLAKREFARQMALKLHSKDRDGQNIGKDKSSVETLSKQAKLPSNIGRNGTKLDTSADCQEQTK